MFGYGGALFFDKAMLNVSDSKFINNSAIEGGAAYIFDSAYILDNVECNGNGNAIHTMYDAQTTRTFITGSDNITDDDFNNSKYYFVIDGVGMQLELLNNTSNITVIPARYDLREENLVTSVKDQGDMGACWTFGALAALESALLKAANYTADFSENNMRNSMLRYSQFGDSRSSEGAANINSFGYLLSWLGAFPRDYDEYNELGKISPLLMTHEDIHIQDVIIIPNVPGDQNSIVNVKRAILNYGALGGGINSKAYDYDENPAGYFNELTSAQYNPNHLGSNHEVCVVGWDDNYSASNFLIAPPGDGAWIVKNSWGTDWGDNGYFYVSYYDKTLASTPENITECFYTFIIENTLPYNNNYQYDFSGMIGGFYKVDTQIAYMNKYEAYEDDMIAAVGTYFGGEGVEYLISIWVNDNLVYIQDGISKYYGYHTIKLDKYVSIKKGDNFSVSINSTEMPVCMNSTTHYSLGTSFSYVDEWEDAVVEDNAVLCLKAYTLPVAFITDNVIRYYSDDEPFYVNVNVGNADVSVLFNGSVITNTSDENGTAIFALPQLSPGVYTIETIYDNVSVINTITVLDTIDVPKSITVGYNANADVNVTFYDKYGNPISSVAMPIVNKIGSYDVVFNNHLTNQTITSTISVVSRISDNKNINMYYFDGSKFSAKIYGADGNLVGKDNVVSIKIDKKIYNVKTDENGTVRLKIPKEITPGTHTITATFAGQTVKNTLKVKQVLKASKVTVKKTAKKLVLKASLKIGKKPIMGKTITFKLNGKTYKAKTNKKGIAQKTLNKKVISKLKKGKTYSIKVTYLKNTIKTTLKVR